METQIDDYVPYGPEWEAELMKWNKKDLIQFLKKQLLTIKESGSLMGGMKEGLKQIDEKLMLLRIKAAREEVVTEGDIYNIQTALFQLDEPLPPSPEK